MTRKEQIEALNTQIALVQGAITHNKSIIDQYLDSLSAAKKYKACLLLNRDALLSNIAADAPALDQSLDVALNTITGAAQGEVT